MFELTEKVEAGKKKKPKKWRKQRPISDEEYEELIRAIREDAAKLKLSNKEVMKRVKSYYGTPRTPDFEEVKKSYWSLVVDFIFVVIFGIIFVVSISFVSSLTFKFGNSDQPVIPPKSDDVVFGSNN